MSEGETIPRCDTWMPFYVNDYLGDTMHLTTEQHGAYFLLLLACWKRGGVLPNEEAQLAAIAKLALPKWRAMRTVILGFFLIADTTLTHKRVNAELANAQDKVTAKQKSGKAGGIAARGKSGRPKSVTNNGTAIISPLKNGSGKIAEELRNNTPSPSQKEESKGSEVKETSGAEAPSLEAEVFRRGKLVLGTKAGGQITKLRKALGFDDVAVLTVLTEAKAKETPAEWLAGFLKRRNGEAETDEFGLPIAEPYDAGEDYRRMGVEGFR